MGNQYTTLRVSRSDWVVTREQLERALVTSAKLIERYNGTEFEVAAIDLFERLENELAKLNKRAAIRERSLAVLETNSGHI